MSFLHQKKFLIFIMGVVALLSTQESKAGALACPTAGTVSSNATWGPIAAGDYYDCSGIEITVNGGVTLTLAGNTASGTGVEIRASKIDVNGNISANGSGYSAGLGPGSGIACGGGMGAGHGGKGGDPNGICGQRPTYGSSTEPITLGSGGDTWNTTGGTGGGAIKLVVSGVLTVNGNITANGISSSGSNAGGGSGGSIWLNAETITGAGSITANGGNSGANPSSGGGGGRIAAYSQNDTFSGLISATGGTGGSPVAESGSIINIASGIYRCSSPVAISLSAAELGAATGLYLDNGCNLTITGTLNLSGNVTVGATASSTLKVVGALSSNVVSVANSATFNLKGNLNATTLGLTGNSKIYCLGDTSTTNGKGCIITAGDATIPAGSAINANGLGFPNNAGPGGGVSCFPGMGASYGGKGGGGACAQRSTYGSSSQPDALGSGGDSWNTTGGAGGGAIKLVVSGTLIVDGSITANGISSAGPAAGGGSGGSIWLDIGTLTGAGSLTANGGNGGDSNSGGGGGGRIAAYSLTNNFTGLITVTAGTGGSPPSETGTLVSLTNGIFKCATAGPMALTAADLNSVTDLIIDSGCILNVTGDVTLSGNVTVGTTLSSRLNYTGTLTANSVAFSNTSRLDLRGTLHSSNFSLSGNSNVYCPGDTSTTNGTGCVITSGTMTIPVGSAINANGLGFPNNAGPGGGTSCVPGIGGSYGGKGGGGGCAQRPVYGSSTQPEALGSGGDTWNTAGGAGGGAVKLVISGILTVNGTITVNGVSSSGAAAGGGSGGSIWIDSGTITGSGAISANGGNGGDNNSGGGGGGRIAVYFETNSFSGPITVTQGTGGSPPPEVGTLVMLRTGKYTSPSLDFGASTISYQTVVYSADIPADTSVSVDFRGGNTAVPDGSWTAWVQGVASGSSLAAFTGNRFLQYRVVLGTSGANKPSLGSISIAAPACYSIGSYYYVTTTSANQFKFARSNTASNVSIMSSMPASTALKALVSFDGGSTWKKHSGLSWADVAGGVSTIGTTGNSMAELAAGLSSYTFGATQPTVDFAFGLESDSCSATPSVTELRFDY